MKITDEIVEIAIKAHQQAKWKGGTVKDHWFAALAAAFDAAYENMIRERNEELMARDGLSDLSRIKMRLLGLEKLRDANDDQR